MDDIYTTLVDFAFGMGFFGRVDLGEQTIQDYMREPLNKMDFNAAMVTALNQMAAEQAKRVVR